MADFPLNALPMAMRRPASIVFAAARPWWKDLYTTPSYSQLMRDGSRKDKAPEKPDTLPAGRAGLAGAGPWRHCDIPSAQREVPGRYVCHNRVPDCTTVSVEHTRCAAPPACRQRVQSAQAKPGTGASAQPCSPAPARARLQGHVYVYVHHVRENQFVNRSCAKPRSSLGLSCVYGCTARGLPPAVPFKHASRCCDLPPWSRCIFHLHPRNVFLTKECRWLDLLM